MSDRPLLIEARRLIGALLPRTVGPARVRISEGRITDLGRVADVPRRVDDQRLVGAMLLPGFVDLHMHGFGGHGFTSGPDEARAAMRAVVATGVTTCYAGLGYGASLDEIEETVRGVAPVVGTDTGGAQLAGIFLEGPYISPEKRGAWNPRNLRLPDIEELRRLVRASGDTIRRVNVAPELPGALPFIEAAVAMGLVVSIGHSNCTYEQALAAANAGARIVNHTFNAMSALDHRSPGLVGAALDDRRLLAELILDGVHVHPVAARTLYRLKGASGVSLITDSSAIAGMPDGDYHFIGRSVTVRDGACRLADGTLAGSVSGFDRDLRHADMWLNPTGGYDREHLGHLSSGNAASVMGMKDWAGLIARDRPADMVVMDDEMRLLATIVGGKLVHQRMPDAEGS